METMKENGKIKCEKKESGEYSVKTFWGGYVVSTTLKYLKNCPLKEKSQVYTLQVTSKGEE